MTQFNQPGQENTLQQLQAEMAELKQLRTEMQGLKNQLSSQTAEIATLRTRLEQPGAASQPAPLSGSPILAKQSSRRRMLKGLGFAVAGLTTLSAVAGSEHTAQAETIRDNAITGNGGANGYGGKFSGGLAPLYLTPKTSAGPGAPTTGTHQVGEFYVDSVGSLFYYTTPGSWATVGAKGTTFPTNPAVGDRYFRTDRGIEYYYTGITGALWQSITDYHIPLVPRDTQDFTQANHGLDVAFPNYQQGGVYLEKIVIGTRFDSVAQSSTNYYTWDFATYDTSSGPTARPITSGPTTTQAYTSINLWYFPELIFNTALPNNTFRGRLAITPTGNPGIFLMHATLTYRLIG